MNQDLTTENRAGAHEGTERKRARLREWLEKTGSEWPLSLGQEALWFIQNKAPASHAYNVAACLEIESPLDVRAFKSAMDYVVQRHPLLRSRIVSRAGKLRQLIDDAIIYDWKNVPIEDASSKEIEDWLIRDYQKPFDLEAGPLCRAYVYRADDSHHYFLLCVHHIVIDGWSLWQLLDEIQEAYSQALSLRSMDLPAVSATYLNFIVKQRAFLKSPRGQAQIQQWIEELPRPVPVLQLPTDQARPPQQTFNGASEVQEFSAEFAKQFRVSARELRVTPFVLGLAIYCVLLHRYARQEQFLVATPSAGRDGSELMDVVGYFVNPLPIVADLSDDPSFDDFLDRLQGRVVRAQEKQGVPFPSLVEHLAINRDPSYPVLCQAMFVYQKQLPAANRIGFAPRFYAWGELRAKHYPLSQQDGQFDLSLEMLEDEGMLAAHWKYNRDLFSASSIESMSKAFECLALDIFAAPEKNLSKFRLIGDQESRALASPPKAVYPVKRCLHQRFSQRAASFGNKVAVQFGEQSISYRELDAKSNGAAKALVEKGVKVGEPIGIAMERSIDLIVAILGVLKAGCCYIPLDPNYPKDRLQYMARDSGIRYVLSQFSLAGEMNFSEGENHVETLFVEHMEADDDFHGPMSTPEQLAYVLYTSGSTGRPKGVMVTHANVMRLFAATEVLYGFGENDVWTLFHSYAFDFTVWEIWGALLYGGKLVVVPYTVSRSPMDFHTLLREQKVTVLNQTPSAFQQLMAIDLQNTSPDLSHLRWVIFGGEALDLQSLGPWFEKYGDTRPSLVNMYGITETTVHVTYRVLRSADAKLAQSRIGKAISDLQLLLLDEHQQVLPPGVPGEIYVGGAGVSNGYLGLEQLSAERFINKPALSRSKLYRTGDLARWIQTESGKLELVYLGRIDDQVQLRGFRIELGEIENQLSSHPAVKTALVLLREDKPGDKRLVAYYTTELCHDPVGWAPLRDFLQSRLPDHMVPAAGVALDSFPLTSNGKVDRKQLPAPHYGGESNYVAPRDALEQSITCLWQEVLDLNSISIHDTFFDLGGHSLLATKLLNRMQEHLGYSIPLATLFQAPTVAKLAAELRESKSQPWTPLVTLQSRGSLAPLFCVPGGSGNALYFQPLAKALGDNRPVVGLQARGLDGQQQPYSSVEEAAAANIEALRAFQNHGPYLIAGHCFGALIALEMAKQLAAQGEAVDQLIVIDAPAPVPEHRPPSIDWDDADWLSYFVDILQESTGLEPDIGKHALMALPFSAQLKHCARYMEAAGVISSGDEDQAAGFIAVFKTNSQMFYRPNTSFRFPISLFRAEEGHPAFDYSGAEDHSDISESSLGWRGLASSLSVKVVPGNHISMLRAPQVDALAASIQAQLSSAASEGAASSQKNFLVKDGLTANNIPSNDHQTHDLEQDFVQSNPEYVV